MPYHILFHKRTDAEVHGLRKPARKDLIRAIRRRLRRKPDRQGKAVHYGLRKLRLDQFRVVYRVFKEEKLVRVLKVPNIKDYGDMLSKIAVAVHTTGL